MSELYVKLVSVQRRLILCMRVCANVCAQVCVCGGHLHIGADYTVPPTHQGWISVSKHDLQ